MTLSKKFDHHARLVERMAARVGIDLDEAMQRGELAASDLRAGVYTCIGCSNPEDCEHWLDRPTDGTDETPAYCRNSDLFKKLAK